MSAYHWPGLHAGTYPSKQDATQCRECGLPHSTARRLPVLRRMLPATTDEIARAHPHLWPRDSAERTTDTLAADLRALGATRDAAGVWRLRVTRDPAADQEPEQVRPRRLPAVEVPVHGRADGTWLWRQEVSGA